MSKFYRNNKRKNYRKVLPKELRERDLWVFPAWNNYLYVKTGKIKKLRNRKTGKIEDLIELVRVAKVSYISSPAKLGQYIYKTKSSVSKMKNPLSHPAYNRWRQDRMDRHAWREAELADIASFKEWLEIPVPIKKGIVK